ncbi:unnamed protein product [Microthlaspi erraticum]|uniref:Uncharacterized protein n=1 Tax=Microthlaspi erraticum TaxID=1685480 RepID=A0A6D2J2J5_9BRAS|nr:unnamed protein product [Microthlaspi erraticum]
MGKWSAIVVITMMVVIAATVTLEVEADESWVQCFQNCAKPCDDNDDACGERCREQCGGPNPPHDPMPPPRRISREMASAGVRGRRE